MIKRFFKALLAIFFPWITMLIYDNPGGAIVALILQTTFIGWIPASMWAFRIMREADEAKGRVRKTKRKRRKKVKEYDDDDDED